MKRVKPSIENTHSKGYLNEFEHKIGKLARSETYLDFCEEVYGYRLALFNMMDREQIDSLAAMLALTAADTVLDLGCRSGALLNHLAQRSGCRGIGIDLLDRDLFCSESEQVNYLQADMTAVSQFKLQPTVTLCVDSLYFIRQVDDLLRYLYRLPGNRMFLFYSQYILKPGEGQCRLKPDGTDLAEALKRTGISYTTIDFSRNEQMLYDRALNAAERLKPAFEREGNLELLEQKMQEDLLGKQLYEQGCASRFLYVIQPTAPLK